MGCLAHPQVSNYLSNSKNYQLVVECDCQSFANLNEFRVVVHGTPRAASDLQFRAEMPAHKHGMYTVPQVSALGANHFIIRGVRLHMAGEWILFFDVAFGGITERTQIPIRVSQ